MQFVPEDGVYVYFRYDGNQTIMCIMNTMTEHKTIDGKRFLERTAGFTHGVDISTGTNYSVTGSISLRPLSMLVLHLGVN